MVGHVQVPNRAASAHRVNVAKLGRTDSQEGLDPGDEQENVEV